MNVSEKTYRRLVRIRRTQRIVCIIYLLISVTAFGLVQHELGWAALLWVASLLPAALLWHLLNLEEKVASDG